MVEFTDDFNALMEDNVQYVSYKRKACLRGESITEEIGGAIPPNVSLEKAQDWYRSRVNHNIQYKARPMLEKEKFNLQGIKTNKDTPWD